MVDNIQVNIFRQGKNGQDEQASPMEIPEFGDKLFEITGNPEIYPDTKALQVKLINTGHLFSLSATKVMSWLPSQSPISSPYKCC